MIEYPVPYTTISLIESLKNSPKIVEKINDSITYAQHMYAALCYNSFQYLDLINILQDATTQYTPHEAESVVLSLQINKNSSNWRNRLSELSDSEFRELYIDDQELYLENRAFVEEGCITHEVLTDLKSIGWINYKL